MTTASGETTKWGRADRRALAAVATQFFANGTAMATWVPRLPEIRTNVAIDTTQMGLVLAAGGLVAVGSSTVVGHINERFGTRAVILVGGLSMALGMYAIGQAPGPIWLILAIGWFSASDSLVDVAMNLQGSWLNARRGTPVMNRLHALWSVGTFVGGFITAQAAARHISVATHTAIASVVLIGVIMVLSQYLLPVDETFDDPESEAEAIGQALYDGDGIAIGAGDPSIDASLPSSKTLIPFVLAGLCVIMFESLPLDWSAFRLTDDFGADAGLAALGFVATTVGMTLVRLVGDSIVVRIGDERLLTISIAVIGVGIVLASLIPNDLVALGGFFLMGVGVATVMPKLYDDAARRKGRPGAGIGALSAGLRIGILSLPLLIGGLVATSLSVGGAIAICGGGALVLFLAIRPILRSVARRKDSEVDDERRTK